MGKLLKPEVVKFVGGDYRPVGYERETIIRFDETSSPATVQTWNPALIRQLDKLVVETEQVTNYRAELIGGVVCKAYALPKTWIKIRKPRELSEEERSARAAVLARNKLAAATK